MATKQPMVGPGVSQWNGWIWFGVQLGSTLWMLLAAAGTAPFAPGLAAVWLLCFAVPNALGTWLWLRRDRMAPHPAYQLLVLLICGSSLSGLLTFDWFWPQGVPRESLWDAYEVCLVEPGVMALWFIVERRTAKQAPQPPHRAAPGTSLGGDVTPPS